MRLRERPVESHPAQWGRGAHPGSKGGSRRVHYAALRSKLYNHLWLFPPLIQHTASLMNAYYVSVQFSSVTQSCLTLCDRMNCSMPGLPVHHKLPEFTQTHVQAIQPSHPLSSPSPPASNPSQHQSLFQ